MDLNEKYNHIITRFSKDWGNSTEIRMSAVNDIYFSRVSQWDDWLQNYTTLQYRGEFDVIKRDIRKILSEFRKNPIEVKYRATDDADPDAADTLMGMYRADMRHNSSIEAVNVATKDQIESGVGAWRIITEYEDEEADNNFQVIRRQALHEAASKVIWDSNARRIDKSDAKHCTVITAFSTEAWKEFAKENNIDEQFPSFQQPDNGWNFNWIRKDCVFVGEYYEIEEKRDTVMFFQSPMGDMKKYYKSEISKHMEELDAAGFNQVGSKRVKRKVCNKYLVTGGKILKGPERIAGNMIPVVPVYGEWAFAGDKEVYQGIVRSAKDAQRLRNMVMSHAVDVTSQTPKKKPFFDPEQIAGFESMYESDSPYPFYYINTRAENNRELPAGPLGYWENPEMSPAAQQLLQLATEAVKEVTTESVSTEAAQSQTSFNTVNQLNMRADMEWFIYMDNLATAMRRDGEIYAAIAAEIYDVPREVMVRTQSGTEKKVKLRESIIDYKEGRVKYINDITKKFDVFTEVGPSYQSMKDQYRAELGELYGNIPPNSPVSNIILMQLLTLMDGKDADILREYANKQLLIQGLKKPENEEEQQIVMQSQQQQQQPDAGQMLAQAQLAVAQAKQQDSVTNRMNAQVNAQLKQAQAIRTIEEAKAINYGAVQDDVKIISEIQHKARQQAIDLHNSGQQAPLKTQDYIRQ